MYVRNPYEIDPEGLEGFWSTVGGGLKRVGQFAVKATTGVSIGNGEAAPAPAPVLSDRGGQDTGMVVASEGSFLDRLRARAMERLRADPGIRETAVDLTSRYASPELLAAAAARQARAQPDFLKASVILPALVVGAFLLRRR